LKFVYIVKVERVKEKVQPRHSACMTALTDVGMHKETTSQPIKNAIDFEKFHYSTYRIVTIYPDLFPNHDLLQAHRRNYEATFHSISTHGPFSFVSSANKVFELVKSESLVTL
jgi:hypothetical protein